MVTTFLRVALSIIVTLLSVGIAVGLLSVLLFALAMLILVGIIAIVVAPKESRYFWRQLVRQGSGFFARIEGLWFDVKTTLDQWMVWASAFTSKPEAPEEASGAQEKRKRRSNVQRRALGLKKLKRRRSKEIS